MVDWLFVLSYAAHYNKHLWLSAGWTYIANLDGSVRRTSQVFRRNNWDAATACADQVAVMRAHVPTHPFGPAFYYSDNVARYFESPNNETNYYYCYPYLQRGIATLKWIGHLKHSPFRGDWNCKCA